MPSGRNARSIVGVPVQPPGSLQPGYILQIDSTGNFFELAANTGSGSEEDVKYAKLIDEVSNGNIAYIGEADPGTLTSVASWRIQRVTFADEDNTSNEDVTIEWADGNASFDNIWDNRASLSYS